MDPHTHSWIVHIRSKDCEQETDGFNTDMRVELAGAIDRIPGHRFHVSLSSAEIPFVWYAVSGYLKSNKLYVDGAPSLEIPDGNYSIYELANLITADPTFPFSMTFNDNNYKVTLTNTSVSAKVINFSQENSRELAKMLGFDRVDSASIPAGGSGVVNWITSQGVVNLRPVHSIFLHSDLAASNVLASTEEKRVVVENILDKIPLGEVGPSQVITYDPYESAPFSTIIVAPAIQTFRLSLRDQNGNLIQLNEARYELSLLIQQELAYDFELDHPAHPYPEMGNSRRRAAMPIPPPPPPEETEEEKELEELKRRAAAVRPTKPFVQSSQRPVALSAMPQKPPTVMPIKKRPRMEPINEEHLQKQEIELNNALLLASSLPTI